MFTIFIRLTTGSRLTLIFFNLFSLIKLSIILINSSAVIFLLAKIFSNKISCIFKVYSRSYFAPNIFL
nr:MAG TPA: hypothetical protein [Caudoviricetes sp.]